MLQPSSPAATPDLRPLFPSAVSDPATSPIDRILDSVRSHLGMEIAFASRIEGGLRRFTHIRADCPVPVAPGDAEVLEETLCYLVLQGELPQLMHDARTYPAALPIGITLGLPVASHLNVPLRLSTGELYGTFCCVNRTPDHSLTERDMATLRAFADLASQLIEADLVTQERDSAVAARIQSALSDDTIRIVHQPIHKLVGGQPVGVECLSRFAGPEPRSPDLWFKDAAAVGLGVEFELAAVRAALRTLGYVPEPHYLSINVSPATVLSGQLADLISGHSPARLVIEITEHDAVDDFAGLGRALDSLRPFARIAIDDVGAGYAGLRHIVDLRPDILKLDMSLTRDIEADPARRALAHALVRFAAEMQCTIVAEGVETEAERDTLVKLQVPLAQGYLYNKPMPVVAAQQVLLGVARAETPAPDLAQRRRA
ncbi:MAG TPA: EAL domain-containing protein [Novosphingobium sp.]|nr:EAL domain-containing protein [Novosphingobium sp.]